MKTFTKTVLISVLIYGLNGRIASAQNQQKVQQIDALVHDANKLGLFNGNLLVEENHQIIYRAAVGYADASGKIPLNEQYRFHIGSIAKEFNAVGMMMLKEEGKLRLEDRVSKYLPELPAWASQIKIINLLQYTSGLPDVKWKSVKNDSDNMTDLQKVEKLDFEPGSSYAYNNNNVFIQRRIIEKITGLSFKEFVVQKLLKPCGMKTAIVDPDNQDQLIARAYDNSRKEDDLHVPISGWTALTLDDFYKWAHAITSFKLISPESSRELLAVFGPNKQSGLGGGSMDGDRMVFHKHDGTARNYQALLISNVLKGRTVILMTNNQQNNLYAINASIQSILDGKPYVKIKKSVTASFSQQIKTMNGPQVLEFYEKMKKEHGEEYNFEAESTLNEIGYMLMNSRKIDDAVLVFEYNTKLFPESGNVYDSLGEAYYALGNKEKALQNYTRSLQLDPTNEVAKKVIAELNKK